MISRYFDNNATTPLNDSVKDALLKTIDLFGNPSSSHRYGIESKSVLVNARAKVATLINASPEEIIFTSGGSESNNTALLGLFGQLDGENKHIITSAIEHPSILEVVNFLKDVHGFEVTYLPVNQHGQISLADVKTALRDNTRLISIMLVNNEIGSIQPIKEVARLVKSKKIHLHCDAVQGVGKIPVDVKQLGVDTLSISGHKFHAPKGIGALYVRKGTQITPLIRGGGQEGSARGGTENIMYIHALGCACEHARNNLDLDFQRLCRLKKLLYHELKQRIKDIKLNGLLNTNNTIPNTLSISIPGIRSEALTAILSEKHGIALSTGAACSSNKKANLSHVLQAIGLDKKAVQSTLRISVGPMNTENDIYYLVDALVSTTALLRTMSTNIPALEKSA